MDTFIHNNYANKIPTKVQFYVHQIKNSINLTDNDIQCINKLSSEERLKILVAYNEQLNYLNSIFNDNM